ncbi:MAG: hypothetical protein RIR70_1689 [Pseudomonadota bacterium]|jgi:type IV pilus assembly protein PilZ
MPQGARSRDEVAVIRVAIHSRAMLAACHMKNVRGEGLFVPEATGFGLYDPVCLVVSLMGEPEVPVMGKVVWVTPSGAVGHRVEGIGVAFDEDAQARLLRAHIHALLAEHEGPRGTHTF